VTVRGLRARDAPDQTAEPKLYRIAAGAVCVSP
jgi:hypothetical protein